MTKYVIAILLFSTQFVYATDCTRNIPGHYIDRFKDTQFDGTVFDSMTGLTWMRCELGKTWDLTDNTCRAELTENLAPIYVTVTWEEALLKAEEANFDAMLSYSDWRLPNVKEIASLTNIACINTETNNSDIALNPEIFPESSATYWSSTPTRLRLPNTASFAEVAQITSPKAWIMNYKANELRVVAVDITVPNAVRLVRGRSQ